MFLLIFFLVTSLSSGSIDSFQDIFIEPPLIEKQNFDKLLAQLLKLDVKMKDVSDILSTFEKPTIVTFPCDKTDKNELVVNVVETRLAGFSVPTEHEGVTILGGTYSWQCKITTSSKGIITMDCDNTLKLNPDVINSENDRDLRVKEVENLVILYHELLHGQLMLDAIKTSEKWRDEVCNKTPSDKINYSYSDKNHVIINPIQEDFTRQLIEQKNGAFFVTEILPEQTTNGEFSAIITTRDNLPQFQHDNLFVSYRGINIQDTSISFPGNEITISGNLRDNSKSATIWTYIFEDTKKQNSLAEKVPSWIKNNAGWWASGKIADSDFLLGIEYLVKNNIIQIHPVSEIFSQSEIIPTWIKNNARWWSEGLISDAEFISAIKYLIEAGIIAY